jgi:hypothetical protein
VDGLSRFVLCFPPGIPHSHLFFDALIIPIIRPQECV